MTRGRDWSFHHEKQYEKSSTEQGNFSSLFFAILALLFPLFSAFPSSSQPPPPHLTIFSILFFHHPRSHSTHSTSSHGCFHSYGCCQSDCEFNFHFPSFWVAFRLKWYFVCVYMYIRHGKWGGCVLSLTFCCLDSIIYAFDSLLVVVVVSSLLSHSRFPLPHFNIIFIS